MADVGIRGRPEGVVAALDVAAARPGTSREVYPRQVGSPVARPGPTIADLAADGIIRWAGP